MKTAICQICQKEYKKHSNNICNQCLYIKHKETFKFCTKRKVEERPWYKTYNAINHRCKQPSCVSYPRYGGRGIQTYLKPTDLEKLWNRDHADLMMHPSIDRIDPDGDYTMENCRYIELRENCRRARRD